MSNAAGTEEKRKSGGLPDWAKLVITGGVVAAIISGVFAVAVAFIAPELGRGWQTRDKRIEVRTALATDMSRSFTRAIGASQRVGTGLIYGPTGKRSANAAVVQGEYNQGLGQWRIDSGRLRAELTARYPGNAIVTHWQRYTVAVIAFYRLGAGIPKPQRIKLIVYLRSYLGNVKHRSSSLQPRVTGISGIDWHALKRTVHFKKRLDFRNAYNKVSDTLLAVGDSYVQKELSLKKPIV
jgi:hypothetical protein